MCEGLDIRRLPQLQVGVFDRPTWPRGGLAPGAQDPCQRFLLAPRARIISEQNRFFDKCVPKQFPRTHFGSIWSGFFFPPCHWFRWGVLPPHWKGWKGGFQNAHFPCLRIEPWVGGTDGPPSRHLARASIPFFRERFTGSQKEDSWGRPLRPGGPRWIGPSHGQGFGGVDVGLGQFQQGNSAWRGSAFNDDRQVGLFDGFSTVRHLQMVFGQHLRRVQSKVSVFLPGDCSLSEDIRGRTPGIAFPTSMQC